MMHRYQDDGYFQGENEGYSAYEAQEAALRATFRRFLRALEARGPCGGKLLEIGCGYGFLLSECRELFRSRTGTDYSHKAVSLARRHAESVYVGGVDAVPSCAKFDCIVANQVIEHVYRPKEFVKGLKEHLNPGGRVVLTTPNMGAFWRRLMGHRWPSFKVPEHVVFFDRASLIRLLEDCELRSIGVLPYPHAFPLPLVGEKLGVRLPSFLGRFSLWLPATTIAAYGVVRDA